MQRRGGEVSSGTVIGVAAIALLFLLIAAATAFQGPIRQESWIATQTLNIPMSPPVGVDSPAPPVPIPTGTPDAGVLGDIGRWLFAALGIGIILLIVSAVARLLAMRRPRGRTGPRRIPLGRGVAATAFAADPVVVRSHVDAALAALDAEPEPADAITAAWLSLERGAADIGVERRASQTAAEFAVVLYSRPGTRVDGVADLLGLYERVRFGGWRPDGTARIRARDDLQQILEAWQ